MTAAQALAPMLDALLTNDVPIGIRFWDGSSLGPASAQIWLIVKNRRALQRIVWAPNELGLARAYVSGEIEVEGDLFTGLGVLDRVALNGEATGLVNITTKAIVAAALKLGAIGWPPPPPAEEARLIGRRHSKRRDGSAIAHHYDVSNDFYRIVLGKSMMYSCGYWTRALGPGFGLDESQLAKCELVASKLGLDARTRLLDVGCGWGTFALHVARTRGARVVAVTLSHEQAAYAQKLMVDQEMTDLVEVRVQDYRDVTDGPYDAISSIGMAEHVGTAQLPTYAAHLFALLTPGGRLLNHAISRRPRPQTRTSRNSFIYRYVFPDGELQTISTMIGVLENAGFEIRDVESLRDHYGWTLRSWVANLERQWQDAVDLASAVRARIWRLYMVGSALAFETNRIGVNQVLAVKSGRYGASGLPLTRGELLSQSL